MSEMDLRTWLVADLANIEQRLESALFEPVPQQRWVEHADGGGSSSAFLLWHLLRHHDIAVNDVLRGRDSVLSGFEVGVGGDVGLGETEDPRVAEGADLDELARYARELFADSRGWLESADLVDLHEPPDALGGLARAGVGEDEYPWLYRMWSDKPRSFFLQWEAIGHVVNHIGELASIKNRLGYGRF